MNTGDLVVINADDYYKGLSGVVHEVRGSMVAVFLPEYNVYMIYQERELIKK